MSTYYIKWLIKIPQLILTINRCLFSWCCERFRTSLMSMRSVERNARATSAARRPAPAMSAAQRGLSAKFTARAASGPPSSPRDTSTMSVTCADSFHNDFRNPIWNVDDDDDTDDELYHHYGGNGTGNFQGGFQVFSNPLEMQRYFEQQMGEILKSFGGMMGTFGNELSPPSTNELPHFGLPSIREKRERSIRDEYLKPGYRSPDLSQRQNRTDSDLDGKMTSDDLDSLFDKKLEGSSQFDLTEEGTSKLEKYTPKSPFPSQPKQHSMFYGQTFMRKSVLLPDGSIETTETRKSSDGQEETTVTISPGRGAGGGSPGALTEPFDNMWTNFFGR